MQNLRKIQRIFYGLKLSIEIVNHRYFIRNLYIFAEICSFLWKYATAYAICTNSWNMQKYAFIRRHFWHLPASLKVGVWVYCPKKVLEKTCIYIEIRSLQLTISFNKYRWKIHKSKERYCILLEFNLTYMGAEKCCDLDTDKRLMENF